jgi:hypothetical protein
MELGNIIAVPLDGQPLGSSAKILLQVMSEEKESGREIEEVSPNVKKIAALGREPWLMKQLQGTVRFKRPDAGQMKVSALDANGYKRSEAGNATEVKLQPDVIYYLISQ